MTGMSLKHEVKVRRDAFCTMLVYYEYGKYHRLNGPAVVMDILQCTWYKYGVLQYVKSIPRWI
jgi:hypothetical protein